MSEVINITPKEIAKALYDLLDKIEELEDKYENAVADYEYEKCKNSKAIEYINDNIAVCAFGNKELPHWEFDDYNIQDLLEILGDKENE